MYCNYIHFPLICPLFCMYEYPRLRLCPDSCCLCKWKLLTTILISVEDGPQKSHTRFKSSHYGGACPSDCSEKSLYWTATQFPSTYLRITTTKFSPYWAIVERILATARGHKQRSAAMDFLTKGFVYAYGRTQRARIVIESRKDVR